VDLAFTNLLEVEELARKKLSRAAFDYIAGGAEDEVSLRRNRDAYGGWALRPRVLVDVGTRDLATTVLGTRVSMPVLIAPTAFHELAHPEGERATATAALQEGVLMVVSTLATRSLEDVAAVGDGPRWFQLYMAKDRAATERLVARARAAGYAALCLTVDTPVAGRRERDERNRFALPAGFRIPNLEDVGLDRMVRIHEGGSAFAAHFNAMLDPALTWADVDWLRSVSSMPVVVKGVMTAEDAALAVDHGVAGIVVSNHGGRQLDGTLGTLDALPEVVEAVQGRAEVFVDGGVRRGTDVVKAIALGARAVLVGRPILYGLALGGTDGVRAVLRHIREELDTAIALVGRPTPSSLDRSVVTRIPAARHVS
jgi:4-hydroxymandelate oxidase